MAKVKQLGYKNDILNSEAPELTKLPLGLEPKEFKSGRVGYYAGGPISLKIGGKLVKFQANISLTAHHSDEWPEARPAPKGKAKQDDAQ